MTGSPFSPSGRRRRVEPALAVLTVTLAVVWVTEPGVLFDRGIVATLVGPAFAPATLLVPGLLATSVLARVGRRGVRLAAAVLGSDSRSSRDATTLRGIATSLLVGTLACTTLWWVLASVYVLTLADAGGVVLAPLVALIVGSVLGGVILGGNLLGRLRAGRDGDHVRAGS